jgi:hypothetical protein
MPSDKSNPSPNNQSHRHLNDPDGVFKGAIEITPSDLNNGSYSQQASIFDQYDVDMWRVHLNAGDTLTVSADTIDHETPDTILAIFDKRGNLLAVDDDSGPGWDAFLQFTALESGNYFIGVSQYPSFPTGGGSFQNGPEYEGVGSGPGNYTFNLDIA